MNNMQKLEEVLIQGDLSSLSKEQRASYYMKVCESTGLNPYTTPFQYIVLNRKLSLYASKAATDQLRKIHGVDIKVTDKNIEDGIFYVTVEAKDKTGRMDSDMGSVVIGNLKGEAKSNAMMKTITKAKRRVTLSICGLGMLDESEIDSIPKHQVQMPESITTEELVQKIEAPTITNHGGQTIYKLSYHNGEEEEFTERDKFTSRYAEIMLTLYTHSKLTKEEKITRLQSFEDRNLLNLQYVDKEIADEQIKKLQQWINELQGDNNGQNSTHT